jgi:hypothetical protein
MKASRVIAYSLLVICIAATSWLVFNRQYVVDQLAVWQYHPTSSVLALSDGSGMSETGRFFYFASQPTVEGTQLFNEKCQRAETQSAILGCYTNGHIYVYNVTDPKLTGITSVTAAHEMLHAAFERLNDGEKQRVTDLLNAEYKKLNNKELNTRMEYYDRAEPGERINELHSIIGTEFADLSPELETYYKKYFDDRQKVIMLHASYKAVFDGIKNKSDELAAQLTKLGDEIEKLSASYNNEIDALNADIAAFNAKAKSGEFTSQSEFNAERAALIARSNELNTQRTLANTKVALYNQLRAQLQEINSQSEALNKSIDSTLAPAPAL